MKLLACFLFAQTFAERTGKAHHHALSSWGHHASVPTTASLPIKARNVNSSKAVAAVRKTAPALLAVENMEAQQKEPHSLRICNAFAYPTAIDVFRGVPPGAVHKLTKETGPLPYRRCSDMAVHIVPGDKLQFLIGDVHLGTFAVTNVPEPSQDMMLLLVFFRNDRETTAMRFASHAFQDKYLPQIAVIDTYLGPMDSWIAMSDREHIEDIAYGTVATVNTGTYEVKLESSDQSQQHSGQMHLDARAHKTYVVMRTGVKAFEGPTYPEELVTFPGGWNSAALVDKLSVVSFIGIVISLWT